MEHFSIVLLPEEETLKLLNDLKLRFNKEGFRYKVSHVASDAHITLAHGYCENHSQLKMVENELSTNLFDTPCIKVADYSLLTVKRPPNEKADYINYWVALGFSNSEIDKIVKKIEDYLSLNSISETERYIDKVNEIDPSSKGKKIVGDHMNLCNYCRENKLEEAISLIDDLNLSSILFDRVGLRSSSGKLEWVINL